MSLRIVPVSAAGAAAAPEHAQLGFRYGVAEGEGYLVRLLKLIPAEALAVYPFLVSRASDAAAAAGAKSPAGAGHPGWAMLPAAAGWLLLLVLILLRWHATRDATGRAQWGAVTLASISFLLWVALIDGGASGGEAAMLGIPRALAELGVAVPLAIQRFIPEFMLILWTFLAPALYRPRD